jgi:hypothetical protein
MTMDEKGVAGLPAARELDFHWGSIIAGALAATALAFVLNSFALALGLSVSSAAPTWRDTSFVLVFLSGLYLILVAIASYAFGAYLAARMRVPLAINSDTAEFQDGVHGLIIWAIATLLTGIVALGTLQLIPRASAPTSVAGESIIAFDLDHLFRGSERRNDNDLTYDRSQAARILFTTSSHSGMDSSDRAYLAQRKISIAHERVASSWRLWRELRHCSEPLPLGWQREPAVITATGMNLFRRFGIGATRPIPGAGPA